MIASLILIEVMLQLAALAHPGLAQILSPGIPRALPDAVLGKRPNPAIGDHDAAGWRNPVALEQADIVVLGDSQTYGDEVSWENAWPIRLGELTGIQSYNMAFSGYGPGVYLKQAPEALGLDPRLLIVAIYSGNDFAGAYINVTMSQDDPALLADAAHDRTYFEQIDEEEGALWSLWRANRLARRGTFRNMVDPFKKNLKIWNLIDGVQHIIEGEAGGRRGDSKRTNFDQYAREVEDLPREDFFPFRDGPVATILTPSARHRVVDTKDARVAEGVRVTIAILDRIKGSCTAPCEFLVVLIPTKELAFANRVAAAGVDAPHSFVQLVAAETRAWDLVRSGLQDREIPFVDVLWSLNDSVMAGANPYLSDWDGHPNVKGNEVIARQVAGHPHIKALERRARARPDTPGS